MEKTSSGAVIGNCVIKNDTFMKITDFKNEVTIRKNKCESRRQYIAKLKRMTKEINYFIDFMENNKNGVNFRTEF